MDNTFLDFVDSGKNNEAATIIQSELNRIIFDQIDDFRKSVIAKTYNVEPIEEKRIVSRTRSTIPGATMTGLTAPFGRNVMRFLRPKQYMTRLAYKYGFRHSGTKSVEGGKVHVFKHPKGTTLNLHAASGGTYWAHHQSSGKKWSHLGQGNTFAGLAKHLRSEFSGERKLRQFKFGPGTN
jgi:hypothetical protein